MYAVVAQVSIPSGKQDEAIEHLQNTVVPRVKQAPGVVAAYWVEPKDGHGQGLIVFESEDAAKTAREMAMQAPGPVTFDSIEVREVIANI